MNVLAPHDPGGKIRIVLPDGVIGEARFHGPNDCYRLWLSRGWTSLELDILSGFILYIGMNPSTADAVANDTTIGRETFFTKRQRYQRFVKCNVMDYRATNPSGLRKPGVIPCSEINLDAIAEFAARADKIICAWGLLHPSLQQHADRTEELLRSQGRELWCFGLNADGSPRHPLYLRGDTPIIRFEENRIEQAQFQAGKSHD